MIDLRTSGLKTLYSASANRWDIVDVPDLAVLAVDGVGDPATSAEYRDAVAALTALAWAVRATLRAGLPSIRIRVMPLEGVWTLPDELIFAEDPAVRAQLRWTLQIVQPDDADLGVVEYSRAVVAHRKPELRALGRVDLRQAPGGPAAQVLHRGPYRNALPVLDRLHCFIREHGGRPTRGHQEIYLNDARRTAPEKLKTILRVGFTRV